MNIFKKTISFIVLLSIIISNSSLSFATQPDTKTLLLQARNELQNIEKWGVYVELIDKKVQSISEDEKALLNLSQKIFAAKEKIENSNNITLKQIVYYIELKIDDALIDISKWNAVEEIIAQNSISKEEKKQVEDKLIQIQLNLLEKWTSYLENLVSEFKKLTNYEEKWNFSMNLDIDQEQIWKVNAAFNLSDYSAKASNFDSQIKWKIHALIEASPKEGEDIKLQLNSLIDFISKEWNIYLLLQELNIVDEEWVDDIKDYLEKIKEIAAQNKYIKFEDKQAKQGIQILKSLSPNRILADGKNILSKPMLKPYKKEDGKYYLIPTKYACDRVKEFMNKFDPFNGKECSQNQYENLLSEIEEVWNIYIKLWDDTQLGFEWVQIDDIDKFDAYLIFSDKEIKEIQAEIIPSQEIFPDEWLILDYKKNEKLNFTFFAEKWNIDYKLWSALNSNNKFHVINFSGVSKSQYNSLSSSLSLNNKKITWNITYTDKKYKSSYEWDIYSGEYVDNNKFEVDISWNTNNQNSISNLQIEVTGTKQDTGKVFENGVFNYSSWTFELKNNYTSEWTKSDLAVSGSWDAENKTLTSWDFKLSIDKKEGQYNYETYEFGYVWDYKNVFNSEVSLENKIITWNTTIHGIDGKKIFWIEHSWGYEKNYIKWNNNFEITNVPRIFLWAITSEENPIIKWNFNIEVDLRNNKDNANIYFDTTISDKQIIQFEIDNKGTIEYKQVEINGPSEDQIVPSSEILPEINNYNY